MKYRVWDIEDKRFLTGYKELTRSFVPDGDGFSMVIKREIWQQYTGYKDAYQKEIYEGDILIFMGKWDKDGSVMRPDYLPYIIQKWGSSLRAFLLSRNTSLIHKHNDIISLPCTDNKIIGNICENPEFLKPPYTRH